MQPTLPRPAAPRSPIDRLREWVGWFGVGRLMATTFAIVAVVIGGTWLLKGSPSRAEDVIPFATRATSTSTSVAPVPAVAPSTTLPTSIVVYVAGEVALPGIYTLASTARVNDAVQAAGGPRPTADLDLVNLAAILHDGQRVYVPAVGEVVPPLIDVAPETAGTSPAGPVNINAATAEQLDVLPGVGPATAAAIVAHRQQHGPFQSVEQLGDVRGIGPAKLDALRGLVTV